MSDDIKALARRITQTNMQAQKGMAADAQERGDTVAAIRHEVNADRFLRRLQKQED